MDQLRKLLDALSMRQRISIGAVALLVLGGLYALTHWLKETDFKPLYTSLTPEDAAAVVAKLKESGTDYRVSDSGTAVLAPSARVAELRLELAGAGLPKSGRPGFEIFDKTNFGATEFVENLNFHRALEGELERSIGALAAVESAQVHITFPKESVFLDANQPAKASVLLTLREGSKLTPQNVAAVTNLVASAVEGLAPESITVIDRRGNLLNRPHRDSVAGDQPSEATIEYRQKLETELLAKVNSTLEPVLGPEKFRAGVSVDCDFTSGEQSDETFDPNKSVMTSSVKTEDQSGSSLASGQPGTASSLPRPTSRPGSGAGGVSRRSENIAFASSRTVRHVKLEQGVIKRMSISILVDHIAQMEGQGKKAHRILVPPSPETLKSIHDLVAAATGFSAERGDQLVIEALPFDSTRNYEPPVAPAPAPVDTRIPKQLAPFVKDFAALLVLATAVAIVLLLCGLAIVYMLNNAKKKKAAEAATAQALPAVEPEAEKALTAEQLTAQFSAQLAEQEARHQALQHQQDLELMNSMKIPVITTKKAEVLIKHLRENIIKDAEGTTNVLRTWLNEPDRTRGN